MACSGLSIGGAMKLRGCTVAATPEGSLVDTDHKDSNSAWSVVLAIRHALKEDGFHAETAEVRRAGSEPAQRHLLIAGVRPEAGDEAAASPAGSALFASLRETLVLWTQRCGRWRIRRYAIEKARRHQAGVGAPGPVDRGRGAAASRATGPE